MTPQLAAIGFHATDPAALARFWAELLNRERADAVTVLPPDGKGFGLRFTESRQPKTRQNQAHFDLTSATPEAQRETVARALALGARHIDIGQTPEEGHIVLADPDGNEFCVIEAGNNFLADTGVIGAVACDGTREVGYFWSEALGWPLVWDQDEETAIQSPQGGTKLTWGGPPVPPKPDVNRLYFELALPADADEATETARLTALGARPGPDGVLLDPDGNEFRVLRTPTP
ncbi:MULTISPECIES: VOC family protein [unclassified Streptomyces]|uniref:VOC family protein n=1 Tax=unclassified Streptomyces TaxID=2593676 RepID=UPI002ECFB179|nr:VOC family protein [Streptomyces sp. NBC_00891]WSY06950.1 VOC family protein [Streptomyces sp. NBC_00890]WSZ08576.1 VOC family protein [Streptomyces sp. NBC_00869]WSZ23925.1 VOC family protein [Streptomyces sp. NBC_00870]